MADLTTLNCPSCGGNLEVSENASFLVCQHCGSEHIVRREGDFVTLESYARCPKCGRNDRVEKVTVIMRSHSEDTGLVKSLTKPIPPDTDPKPEPTPKPELPPEPSLTPKPGLKPKPTLPPKPKIFIRKPKMVFLIIALAPLLIAYVFALTSFGMLIEEFDVASSICSGIAVFIAVFFSAILIYLGLSAKIEISESMETVEALKDRFAQTKLSPINSLIPVSFSLISVGCILLSLVAGIFRESVGTITMALALGFIPAIIGLYLYLMKYDIASVNKRNLNFLQNQNSELLDWEQANSIAIDTWKQYNKELLDPWEMENSQILNDWQAEKSILLEDWKRSNAQRMKGWEEKYAAILSDWYIAKTRWEKLYFCHRDDIVFIPGEGTFAPTEKMQNYLAQSKE